MNTLTHTEIRLDFRTCMYWCLRSIHGQRPVLRKPLGGIAKKWVNTCLVDIQLPVATFRNAGVMNTVIIERVHVGLRRICVENRWDASQYEGSCWIINPYSSSVKICPFDMPVVNTPLIAIFYRTRIFVFVHTCQIYLPISPGAWHYMPFIVRTWCVHMLIFSRF